MVLEVGIDMVFASELRVVCGGLGDAEGGLAWAVVVPWWSSVCLLVVLLLMSAVTAGGWVARVAGGGRPARVVHTIRSYVVCLI